MSKQSKLLEVLLQLLEEYDNIQAVIESLPRGYISTKVISGHTYHYRQWREGSHVLSTYVPDALLNSVKQKIVIRKQNEELLKVLKADIKKNEKALIKAGVLTDESAKALRNATAEERLEIVKSL
jgi:hypothetical protein